MTRKLLRQSDLPLTLRCEMPPSTNQLFFSRGRRRVKTRCYSAWLASAVPLLAAQARLADWDHAGPVHVEVTVGKCRRSRDLDNFLKPVLDAMVQARVIRDDNMITVRSIAISHDAKSPSPVVIRVQSASR